MDVGDTLSSNLGSYAIVRELGSGSFGKVYLANFTNKSGRESQVALKEISMREYNPKQCMEEANLMKKISSSSSSTHIVKYLDSFIAKVSRAGIFSWFGLGGASPSEGNLIIAMSYCSGGDLSDEIRSFTRNTREMPKDVVYNYTFQIADGLNELHNKHGIVHCDLKPANILVAMESGKKVLKISDFGLAKVWTYKTYNGNKRRAYGTPHYWAPEQETRACTFAVDVWAAGMIFVEMAKSPKTYSTVHPALRIDVDRGNAITLPSRFTTADNDWATKMLKKKPEDRMTTSDCLAEAKKRL